VVTPAEYFEQNLPLIERVMAFVARRGHVSPNDIDDFKSYALVRLIENEYRILGQFAERSSLPTYLTVVLHRLLLDYRIALWGKWRPSAQAERLGPDAIALERLRERDRLSREEAIEQLIAESGGRLDREALDALDAQLPQRTRRQMVDEPALDLVVDPAPGPEAVVVRIERRGAKVRLGQALQSALSRLSPEDRLLVRLRFVIGLTMPQIAKRLGVVDIKPLYRRVERVCTLLRQDLEAQGITASQIRGMFDDPDDGGGSSGSAAVVIRITPRRGGGAAAPR
jgi:RNA polymerase sigma factor for flagellar operon FliA